MSEYLLRHGGTRVPQSEALREDQVENSASGFVWEVDEWTRLRRFLILGSEGGSYYATERELTKSNIKTLRQCITRDGVRTVSEIVDVSFGGLAPKNDQALFALAACITLGDRETKSAAAESLPKVARTGTHLFNFITYVQALDGPTWGRTMRWAIGNWYASKSIDSLAYQVIKYRQRDGWTHRDVLRLAHPFGSDSSSLKPSDELRPIFDWITHGNADTGNALIEGFVKAQASSSPAETARLIREYGLPREALVTEHLTAPEVWEAMLETGMPVMAMTRNLANMTRSGVLESRENRDLVLKTVGNRDAITKSRLHPLAILVAQRTYALGRGYRGQNTWAPIPDVIDALDEAFYLAFGNVESTGKKILLALDVSGSMTSGQVAGSPLSPREAAAAMALVTLHAESDVEVVGFHAAEGGYSIPNTGSRYGWANTGISPLGLSRRQRIDDVVKMTANLPFGRTDCALPFLYAMTIGKSYDAFIVYTDSETWFGQVHPKQALDDYRRRSGVQARSVVVGMVANNFSIADPNDPGMLDVVGFDTSAPNVISGFVRGGF